MAFLSSDVSREPVRQVCGLLRGHISEVHCSSRGKPGSLQRPFQDVLDLARCPAELCVLGDSGELSCHREKKKICCMGPATVAETEPAAAQHDKFPLNVTDVLCEYLSRDDMDRLADHLPTDVVEGSAATVIENKMKRSGPGNHVTFLETLLSHWHAIVPQAGEAELVQALEVLCVPAARGCQEVLQPAISGPTTEQPISLPVSRYIPVERHSIPFLCYAEHARHHGDDCQPLPTISSLLHEQRLQGAMSPFIHRAIDTVFKHYPSSVDLRLFRFNPGSACQVPPALAECNQLQKVHMENCKGQWKPITRAIQNSSATLTSITSLCMLGADDISSFASALQCCSELQILRIHVRDTTLASAILTAVSSIPSLRDLYIAARSPSVRHDEPLVVPDLRQCRSLASLWLRSCHHLSGSSLHDLALAVQHIPRLSAAERLPNCWVSASAEECNECNRKVRWALGTLRPGETGLYGSYRPPKNTTLL